MVDVICTPVPDTSAPVISAPEADTPAAKHGSRMTAIILKPTSFIKPL